MLHFELYSQVIFADFFRLLIRSFVNFDNMTLAALFVLYGMGNVTAFHLILWPLIDIVVL